MSKIQEEIEFDEDEVNYEHVSRTTEENEFDLIVTTLEELLLDNRFQEMQSRFCERHCDVFEETKENKLEYTSVFQEYTGTIERMIEERLRERIPGFTMSRLERILEARKDELSGEVFDLLNSLGDFLDFKDLMLSFKRSKTNSLSSSGKSSGGKGGGGTGGFGGGFDLSITGKKV